MKKAKKQVSSIFVFITFFIVTYLLMGIAFWVYQNTSSYNQKSTIQNKYISKHEKTLKKDIFENLFKHAKSCLRLKGVYKEQCHEEVSYKMAVAIIETDLNEYKENTAHDLSFVKRVGDNYYKLGWDGELTDVTSIANKSIIDLSVAQYIRFLTRTCNYFGTAGYPAPSCEVYATLKLNSNETGYIIGHVGFTEENVIWFYIIIPLLILSSIVSVFHEGFASNFHLQMVLFALLFIIIPSVVGVVGMRRYRKNFY